MNNIQIPGFATYNSNGQFHFESGYPSKSSIVKASRQRGTLFTHPNACIDFVPDSQRIYLPPVVKAVCCYDDYNIRRTSRNYVVQFKVPIVETRKATEKKIKALIPQVIGDIIIDRKEIIG